MMDILRNIIVDLKYNSTMRRSYLYEAIMEAHGGFP